MNTQQESSQISLSEILQALQDHVADADLLRAAGLEGLQGIRAVKAIGMQRELIRLGEKLGDQHPRVLALTDALALNQSFIRDLSVEIDRAKTQVPTVNRDTWVVHGFVHKQDGTGVPALTVMLYDSQGLRAKDVDYAYTDERGYFKLEYGKVSDSSVSLYLRITDGQGRLLFRDDFSLTPTAGKVDYREIVLADSVTSDLPR
jgi:hypothetical protein